MPEVTDIKAYSALDTENEPRYLVRLSNNNILLDGTGVVATLAGSGPGVFFIAHRPNQSPQAWMYIAAPEDYQKLSAPTPAVTAYKAGIQEPQSPPATSPDFFDAAFFSDHDGTVWVSGGTAGANVEGTRVSDTISDVVLDPASTSRYSVQVSAGKYYQVGQKVIVGNASDFQALILDVIPETNPATRIEIEAIHYFSGSTGLCVITPAQTPINPSIPTAVGPDLIAGTIFGQSTLASLRRGALVDIEYETVMVLSVTLGPTGQLSFECITTGTHSPGDYILGLPTLIIDHPSMSTGEIGQAIKSYSTDATLTGAGVGTLSAGLSNNPFSTNQGQQAQLDDYLSFSVNVADLSTLVIGRIIFNVGPTVDYATDVFYAEFTAADVAKPQKNLGINAIAAAPTFDEFFALTAAQITGPFRATVIADPTFRARVQTRYDELYGNQTPATTGDTVVYPANQWSVIQLPVRALQRAGNDQSRTLANTNGVQLQFQLTATTNVKISSLWVGGGGQPDVGRSGSPYLYRVRGRSTLTGALSNPSPSTRYGTYNRRQSTRVSITDLVGDAQQDTWDIFRYGGTVTSWRYAGSMPCTGLNNTDTFTDNLFDTAVLLNPALEFDNFEPWPSVGLPVPSLDGTGSVDGTVLDITFTNSAAVPAEILRWLPGTLLVVNNVAYTLYTRPTHITGNRYVLETVESMGAATLTTFTVQEPIVGNQHLPYVFGPDAAGTVFGCGDPLRPGTLAFSKSNNPDSVPDTFNQEITAPTEPLLGGLIMNGIAYVASSQRWWALYPSFQDLNRYQVVERAISRGLAAPYAHCNDRTRAFYFAIDGIWMHDGSAGRSMTDADLRTLFPYEGVDGADYNYASKTIHAPDYEQINQFRLAYYKGYLYADYIDSSSARRTLVLDTTHERIGWSVDQYADPIRVHYGIEGPEESLGSTPSAFDRLILGDTAGLTYVQTPLSNDNGVPIDAFISTFEWNGGDLRANQFWGDTLLDLNTPSGATVTPIGNALGLAIPTTIPVTPTREQKVVKSSGIEAKSLGILVEWTDDFDYYQLTRSTELFAWQPLYQAIPIKVYKWKTQGTSFGSRGYFHIREVRASYISTADVTLTITAYDGNSPDTITLPSTGGQQHKLILPVSFNKALLVFFEGVSDEPWQPFFDAWETLVGGWGRTDEYKTFTDIEAPSGLARSIE